MFQSVALSACFVEVSLEEIKSSKEQQLIDFFSSADNPQIYSRSLKSLLKRGLRKYPNMNQRNAMQQISFTGNRS